MIRKWSLATLAALVVLASAAGAQERYLTLASTTSTDNSGLFEYLLPLFEAKTGIGMRVVAVGTGQALRLARNGDADVLLVHHKPSEERFVAEGYGVKRYDVMYNDFVIVGPREDPAGIRGFSDATKAFQRIAERQVRFASRGDDSGTNKKEREIWQAAGIDVDQASGDWYRETGAGMGATLNTANGLEAYTLTDRSTWVSFKNKGTLQLLLEGDPQLYNQYGVILVNPERHPQVKAVEGQSFIVWLLSREGQQAIADFRVNGQRLFIPNAKVGE